MLHTEIIKKPNGLYVGELYTPGKGSLIWSDPIGAYTKKNNIRVPNASEHCLYGASRVFDLSAENILKRAAKKYERYQSVHLPYDNGMLGLRRVKRLDTPYESPGVYKTFEDIRKSATDFQNVYNMAHPSTRMLCVVSGGTATQATGYVMVSKHPDKAGDELTLWIHDQFSEYKFLETVGPDLAQLDDEERAALSRVRSSIAESIGNRQFVEPGPRGFHNPSVYQTAPQGAIVVDIQNFTSTTNRVLDLPVDQRPKLETTEDGVSIVVGGKILKTFRSKGQAMRELVSGTWK